MLIWFGVQELQEKNQVTKDQADQHAHLNIVGMVGSIDNDFCGTDMTIVSEPAQYKIQKRKHCLHWVTKIRRCNQSKKCLTKFSTTILGLEMAWLMGGDTDCHRAVLGSDLLASNTVSCWLIL